MEHDDFQQDVQDHDVDQSFDMATDPLMQALHLPPGLDLLFQMLDEMSDGFNPPPAEKMTPTPYYRTPSLGS